jgi:hypothetical protein
MLAAINFFLPALCLLSSLISAVSAHGFIKEVTIAGQTYPGWDPNLDPYTGTPTTRVIRKIPNDGPVTDTSSADMSCNTLGEAGQPISADAKPGDKIVWQWNQWLEDHHGPVWTYMASCEGPCSSFDLSADKGGKNLKWFKIDAQGYDASSKKWASDDLRAAGNKWTSTIPANLKAGEYLVRHEIVALHSAPAQYYPACAQIKLSGSGSATPSGNDLVSIPGLFKQSQFPNIWGEGVSFTIPGPAVFGSSGSGTNDNGNDQSSVTSTKGPASATEGVATATSATSAAPAATTSKKPAQCRVTNARTGSKRHALVRRSSQMHRRSHH